MSFQVVANISGDRRVIETIDHAPNAKDLAMRAVTDTPFGLTAEVVEVSTGRLIGHARREKRGQGAEWHQAQWVIRREVLCA